MMSARLKCGSAGAVWLRRTLVFWTLTLVFAPGCVRAAVYGAVARPVDPQGAWLTYAPVDAARVFGAVAAPDTVLRLGDTELEKTAEDEMASGFRGMLGRVVREVDGGEVLTGSKSF